jgi:hypothetical protein
MTTLTLADAPSRFDILPSGIRLVRLGPDDEVWVREYEKILSVSAQDFLARAGQAGTPEGVVAEVRDALTQESRAVWFVLQPDYRFLGFALAEIVREFGAPPRVFVQATYLYPRRTPRSVLPALTQAIRAWGAACGAASLDFQTRRPSAGAWQRVGARPIATLYRVPIGDA